MMSKSWLRSTGEGISVDVMRACLVATIHAYAAVEQTVNFADVSATACSAQLLATHLTVDCFLS